MGRIEDIIMQKSGARGMQRLRPYLPEDYASGAARTILGWERGTVLLTTGFYVAGFAETDGPAGTLVLAKALQALGFHPVVLTDDFCRGFFEPEGIDFFYLPLDADETDCRGVLKKFRPVGMISIERCGLNTHNDYENMRGLSIKAHTAPCDLIFRMAGPAIPTIGVGDGGNEIGMGNLRKEISNLLSLTPCIVETDALVIATVSNWGAYGIAAALEKESGKVVFSRIDGKRPRDKVAAFLEAIVQIGSVDGVTHERVPHVDGFDEEVELQVLDDLTDVCSYR